MGSGQMIPQINLWKLVEIIVTDLGHRDKKQRVPNKTLRRTKNSCKIAIDF